MRGAILLAAVVVAACGGERGGGPDADAAVRGRSERAFWAEYDRARASLARDDIDAARAAFRDALAGKPDHAASLYALAGIEHRAGRHDEALALCTRLVEVDRPRTRALLLRAAIRGDVEAVLASGGSAGPWFDLAQADADVAEAQRENPEETGPHLARAKLALLRRDEDTAEAALARALTIHPGHAEGLVLRAVLALRRGDEPGAAAAVARALAVTVPKAQTLPAGEGDTEASLAAAARLDTPRLRALAAALRTEFSAWPPDAPIRPHLARFPHDLPARSGDPLRSVADFDSDGHADELIARRATEADALHSLFGIRDAARGSFTLRLGARDATAGSGLDGVAACVGRLAVVDADEDGRPDVVVLPGEGDPSRVEPPLLLRNVGGGRFVVEPADPRRRSPAPATDR